MTKQECGESYDDEVGIKYNDEMTMVSRTRCGDNCVGSVDSHSEDRNDEEVIPGTQGDDVKLPGTPSTDNNNNITTTTITTNTTNTTNTTTTTIATTTTTTATTIINL